MNWHRLVRFVSRLVGRHRPPSGPLLDGWLRNWRPPSSEWPIDPCEGVREPRRGRPGGRSSAAAVQEPATQQMVDAVSRIRRLHRDLSRDAQETVGAAR